MLSVLFQQLAKLSNAQPAKLCASARSRIICALFAGSAAGVLGVEGLPGFGLFFLQHAACSALLAYKTGGNPGKYFYYGCAAGCHCALARLCAHAYDLALARPHAHTKDQVHDRKDRTAARLRACGCRRVERPGGCRPMCAAAPMQ